MNEVFLLYRDYHEDQHIVSAHATLVGAERAAAALHTGVPSGSGYFDRPDVCATWQPKGDHHGGTDCAGSIDASLNCSVKIAQRHVSD